MGEKEEIKKISRAWFLTKNIISSDEHDFIGRIFGLEVLFLNILSFKELNEYEDCKYFYTVSSDLNRLVKRVETLNLVGKMLWPKPFPAPKSLPISLYEWLNAAADIFLLRLVSIVDCSLRLVNAVCEVGLRPNECTISNLNKKRVSPSILANLKAMRDQQYCLRSERNERIHEGVERKFTLDDQIFSMASLYFGKVHGTDRCGRRIDPVRSFREGLIGMQRDFNTSTRMLGRHLDTLYDQLGIEFECRFQPRVRAAKHGFNDKIS